MPHSHDHSVCIEDALVEAERICKERGSRFTDLRRQILTMIWQGHTAVKAYDLLDQLADWSPDEALRKKILVDNPAQLYGF